MHAEEECPGCGEVFTCKVNSVLKCDCMKVRLTKKETERIRDISLMEFDGGCLCNRCLLELKNKVE